MNKETLDKLRQAVSIVLSTRLEHTAAHYFVGPLPGLRVGLAFIAHDESRFDSGVAMDLEMAEHFLMALADAIKTSKQLNARFGMPEPEGEQ